MKENREDRDYAARHNDLFAGPGEEFLRCAELLRLAPGDRVVDFGCGNGDFLDAALRTAASAVGVDQAGSRLAVAALRFKGDSRLKLAKASLLGFDPAGETFTKGFSRKALHRLTDREKGLFFAKTGKIFAPGALFLVEDFIFDFERPDLDRNWPGLMKDCAAYYGASWERRKKEMIFCFRKEYPAGIKAWTSALAAGGFKVIRRSRRSSFYGSLLAEKEQRNRYYI